MEKISTEILRELYAESSAYADVFNYLAERQRNYRETRPEILIIRLKERGVEIERPSIIYFFRELERAHCGRYIEGRWGHSSRFEWHTKMSDVGLAAKGEQENVSELEESGFFDDLSEMAAVKNSITHEFYLRPDFPIKISLPADLRRLEADRIADWVKALPFGE